MIMIFRDILILFTLFSYTKAFWWNSNRPVEPPPAVKQIPIGYFRAYTYQPLPFGPQVANQYFSYQVSAAKPMSPYLNWPQKSFPSMQQLHSEQHINLPVNSPLAAESYTHTTTTTTTTTQPPPPPTTQSDSVTPPQIDTDPMAVNSVRQFQHSPSDPLNLQYFANVPPPPMQHIQFVPCMCPVSLSLTPEVVANKRSDDISEIRNMNVDIVADQDKLNVQQSPSPITVVS